MMLISSNSKEKEFDELMKEAISQILLYSNEWTNFNTSDPGITILENFTAFGALQRSYMSEVTEKSKENLCALAGFIRKSGAASLVYLTTKEKMQENQKVKFYRNQKFYSGNICFETDQEAEIQSGIITNIFREINGDITEISEVIADTESKVSCFPFGSAPAAGNSIYLVFSALPKQGEKIRIYVRGKQLFPRNAFLKGQENLFSDISFSLCTKNGYVQMMHKDESGVFLQDGLIELRMPKLMGCEDKRFTDNGFVIKGTLIRAEFDIAPRILSLTSPLFPVWQKDTKAITLFLEGQRRVFLRNGMIKNSYLMVYGLEEDGYYHEYTDNQTSGAGAKRTYHKVEKGADSCHFTFSRPCLKNAFVLRSQETMLHYRLGTVYGYREQRMELAPYLSILPKNFMITACIKNNLGENIYQFFEPDDNRPGALKYRLLEQEGAVEIDDAGDYEEAVLLLSGCAVYLGTEGNIRSGNEFTAADKPDFPLLYNPMQGKNGALPENIQEVRRRFAEDLNTPFTLVTGGDYETIIRNIPGQCIHKVRAFAGRESNDVKVAVKPYSNDRFPKMSGICKNLIQKEIEKRRMVTTRVILQQPVYVPIDVKGCVYIKPIHENYVERIINLLKEKLDYINGPGNFGEVISFHEIYQAMEELDCVEGIYNLLITPRVSRYVIMQGVDIRMLENCLCYPGRIELEYGRAEK